MAILTPDVPEWEKFVELLSGAEGCNFRGSTASDLTWKCDGSVEKPLARAILEKYFPQFDVHETLAYFEDYGGYCDCEILFNVDR